MTLWQPIALGALWFGIALALSAAITSRLIGWTGSRGVVDRPNSRSSHHRVTPRGGGLAIVGGTTGAAILSAILQPESWQPIVAMVAASLAIASVSWRDDIRPVSNRVRFGVHLAAAIAAVAALGPLDEVGVGSFGRIDLGVAAWPLTLLWIVGMTNAFNFMDGIDGIAGITAVAAGGALAAAAAALGVPVLLGVSLAFAGSALGFLSCNWPPARIFMGDVGSAFCGFMIAVLPLAAGSNEASRLVPIVALTMWPFIFDTALTLARRLSKRENIFEAHRSHLYQRLVIAGWSHRAVSSLYGGLSAMAAAVAVAPLFDPALQKTATLLAAGTVLVGAALLLAFVSISEKNVESSPSEGKPEAQAPGIRAWRSSSGPSISSPPCS
ncbi:MAG: glycosyltransferase family 4 protein [Planctomycetia bacterium]|nr:glycosyltransferase family 4 protein [Planctomycetia bacterium]